MLATWEDLLIEAFVSLGVISAGGTISTSMKTDASLKGNQMLRAWANDPLLANAKYHEMFIPTVSVYRYTVGVGSSFVSTVNPVRITGAVSISGNFRSAVKIVPYDDFESQVDDVIGSRAVLAKIMGVDNASTPTNVQIFPVPDVSPGQLWIDYTGPFAQYALADTVNLAEGFEEAIYLNVAAKLYPQYARVRGALPELFAMAEAAKEMIRTNNRAIGSNTPAT